MILLRSIASSLLARESRTHEEIAAKIGVHRSLAGHWLSGRRKPSLRHRKALSTAYGIPIDSWDQPYDDAPTTTKAKRSAHRVAKYPARRSLPPEEPVIPAGDVRSRAVQLSELVSKLMADANASHIAAERSKIASRATAALTLLGRMTGESQDMPEQRIVKFPAVRRVLDVVVAACAPWPAAQTAVLEALKRFG